MRGTIDYLNGLFVDESDSHYTEEERDEHNKHIELVSEILQRATDTLEEAKKDTRLHQPSATVFANAPLALIQMGLSARVHAIEHVLGLPLSKIPIKL